MRIFAVIINLVQMGIVLTVFLGQGLKLGGSIILVFFLMLVFAFINLIVLLFYAVSDTNSPILGEEKPGIVKRQDLRVTYTPNRQPSLFIEGQRFSVLDLAENGVRFSIPRNQRIKRRARAEITLLCGQTFKVRGGLGRREGNDATLMFKKPLSFETLSTERRMVQNS
jgi:hypothetical protein